MTPHTDESGDSISHVEEQSAYAYGRLYMAIGAIREERWFTAVGHAQAAIDHLTSLVQEVTPDV
jgi:hypothetical protein